MMCFVVIVSCLVLMVIVVIVELLFVFDEIWGFDVMGVIEGIYMLV